MTTDLEDRLRVDLVEAAERNDFGVEVDAIIGSGRRIVRSRNLRVAAGGVAMAVMVALLGWSGLAALRGAGTPPAIPAAPVPAGLTQTAYFDVGGRGLDPESSFEQIQVTADPVGADWSLTVRMYPASGAARVVRFDAPSGEVAYRKVAPQVVVGVIPDRVDDWHFGTGRPLAGGAQSESSTVGVLDLTAFVVTFDRADQADNVAGVVWRDRAGTLRDSLGSVIPRVELTLSDRILTVFWDERLNVLGWEDSLRGSAEMVGRSELHDRFLGPSEVFAVGAHDPADQRSTIIIGDILPAGARDVVLTPTDPAAEVVRGELAGRIVYAARARVAEGDSLGMSVSLVTAEGKSVSFPER